MMNQLLAVNWSAVMVYVHFLVVLWLLIRILLHQPNKNVAIAWIAILFALPILGVLAYFLFGEINIGKRYRQRSTQAQLILKDFAKTQHIDFSQVAHIPSTTYTQISQLGYLKTGMGAYDNHTATLLTHADGIFDALLHDIHSAKHTILLEFYIVYPKGRVLEIFDALIKAAVRGVECHLLADSVGSHTFFRSTQHKQLQQAGIHIHESLPVGLFKTLFRRIDIRNHRKLAVFDNTYGYIGSFNLIDPNFFKQHARVGKWVDVMIRLENHDSVNAVKAMSLVTSTDISAETKNNLSSLQLYINNFTKRLYMADSPIDDEHNHPAHTHDLPQATDDALDNKVAYPPVSRVTVQLIPSAPELTGHVIYETLICAIFAAKKQIVITTPYFVPDDALLLALTTAAKRGVTVILNIPKKVDSRLVRYASRAYYEPLLKAGVQIALFTGGLLHAKIVSIDSHYCLFGTVNMDMRSFYLNMEVSIAIYDTPMIEQILDCQHGFLTHSDWLNVTIWQQRPFLSKFFDNGIRLLSPLL